MALLKSRKSSALSFPKKKKDEYQYNVVLVGKLSNKVYKNSDFLDEQNLNAWMKTINEPVEGRLVEASRINGIYSERVFKRFSLREDKVAWTMREAADVLNKEPAGRFLEMITNDRGNLSMILFERSLVLSPEAWNKASVETAILREEEIDAKDGNATVLAADFAAFAQTQIDEYEQARRGNDETSGKVVEADALRLAIEASLSAQS